MEQKPQKKEWTKPELIVLVRSKPEEAVLTACKYHPNPPNTPGTTFATCRIEACAGLCNVITSS